MLTRDRSASSAPAVQGPGPVQAVYADPSLVMLDPLAWTAS